MKQSAEDKMGIVMDILAPFELCGANRAVAENILNSLIDEQEYVRGRGVGVKAYMMGYKEKIRKIIKVFNQHKMYKCWLDDEAEDMAKEILSSFPSEEEIAKRMIDKHLEKGTPDRAITWLKFHKLWLSTQKETDE